MRSPAHPSMTADTEAVNGSQPLYFCKYTDNPVQSPRRTKVAASSPYPYWAPELQSVVAPS